MDSKRKSEIRNHLLNVSPSEFEQFVAKIWEQMGWNTRVTSDSNDDGIDVVATKSGIHEEKAVIQAKRYSPSNKIGQPDIQQYDTLRRQDSSVDVVVVVTTSEFSDKAEDLAEQLNVKTINGSAIAKAALENLPDECLSDLIKSNHNSKSVDQTEPDRETNEDSANTKSGMVLSSELEIEDLSPVETVLAEIYQKNWQKRSEDSSGASLHFQFEETPENLEFYQFYKGIHNIKFKLSENEKITSRTALKKSNDVSQAAKKYDKEASSSGRSVNIMPNYDFEKESNPEHEARFTNIVVTEFLDSSLSQIHLLTETAHDSETTAESYHLSND